MTLFPYGEKPSDSYRAGEQAQQLAGDDVQAGDTSPIAISPSVQSVAGHRWGCLK